MSVFCNYFVIEEVKVDGWSVGRFWVKNVVCVVIYLQHRGLFSVAGQGMKLLRG